MKLLAKAAEERYQSAAGLQADLARWTTEWEAGRELGEAASGRSDVGDRFLLPQRYGGEQGCDRGERNKSKAMNHDAASSWPSTLL